MVADGGQPQQGWRRPASGPGAHTDRVTSRGRSARRRPRRIWPVALLTGCATLVAACAVSGAAVPPVPAVPGTTTAAVAPPGGSTAVATTATTTATRTIDVGGTRR